MASHQFRCTHLLPWAATTTAQSKQYEYDHQRHRYECSNRTPEVLLLVAYPSNLMDSAHHMGKEIGQLEKDLGITSERQSI